MSSLYLKRIHRFKLLISFFESHCKKQIKNSHLILDKTLAVNYILIKLMHLIILHESE